MSTNSASNPDRCAIGGCWYLDCYSILGSRWFNQIICECFNSFYETWFLFERPNSCIFAIVHNKIEIFLPKHEYNDEFQELIHLSSTSKIKPLNFFKQIKLYQNVNNSFSIRYSIRATRLICDTLSAMFLL